VGQTVANLQSGGAGFAINENLVLGCHAVHL
jgi:hypothetical protein